MFAPVQSLLPAVTDHGLYRAAGVFVEFSQALLQGRTWEGSSPDPPAFLISVTIHCAAGQAPASLWPSDGLRHQEEALPLDSMTREARRPVSSVKTRGHEGTGRGGQTEQGEREDRARASCREHLLGDVS